MSNKIKFLWDFMGPNSLKIAEHHCIHLKEYAATEKLDYHQIEKQIISEMYTIAYLIIDKTYMDLHRKLLKPHRGQIVK